MSERTRGDDAPVVDEAGRPFAGSITEAAERLGCSRPTLYACSEPCESGRRLTRRPRQQQQHGSAPRPALLPGEAEPRTSVAAAARAAGLTRQALYNRGMRGPGGELIVRPANRQNRQKGTGHE